MRLDEQGRIVEDQRLPRLRQPCRAWAEPDCCSSADNPNGHAVRGRRALYLLTYGNGFNVISPQAGMYKWEYSKGSKRRRPVP